jgi:hypothetical protein
MCDGNAMFVFAPVRLYYKMCKLTAVLAQAFSIKNMEGKIHKAIPRAGAVEAREGP